MAEIPPIQSEKSAQPGHQPVLLDEILETLNPRPGQMIVDCTVGRGGHSLELARRIAPGGVLVALDTDPRNLEFAHQRLNAAPKPDCQIRLFHANFNQLDDVLDEARIQLVDSILADLGVSTNQLFDPAYGLSFDADAPLDMRLDPGTEKSAADLVNLLPETELANVLYEMAQERYSRQIARKIVEARRLVPIQSTGRLAELVRAAIPRKKGPPPRIDPATRTFLALRLAVNNEPANLARLLDRAPKRLKPAGCLAVISFQSTEDRLVKQAMRMLDQSGAFEPPVKSRTPSDAEVARNPRSRSARLRMIRKRLT
jgi:16S rRNA (cytosine1402-N4)-methyltransferase